MHPERAWTVVLALTIGFAISWSWIPGIAKSPGDWRSAPVDEAMAAPDREAPSEVMKARADAVLARRVLRLTHYDLQAAAARAAMRDAPVLRMTAMPGHEMAPPGSVPHYYGPYPNYANSPLRLPDAMVHIAGDGTGAEAMADVDLRTGAITGITVTAGGTGYTMAEVMIMSTFGTGAVATATVADGAVTDITVTSGGTGYVTPGMRKFVDTLPGLGPAGANNLGQYIPVAIPDTTTYPGTDYYEIAVVQYEEQMHSDLPPTLLRGYVQLSTSVVPGQQVPLYHTPGYTPILLPDGSQALGVDRPHYLGPAIIATRDRPVRILFRNLLPVGQGGNLFLPVDTTVMGSGMGPLMAGMAEPDPLNPMCGGLPKPFECFTENRATLHLHGGNTPWISDGTPHQWITPANENTPYPEGVSVVNVPDMPDPGPGAMTFFYSNQQSARLLFYHDHSWGITRLNVYAGEAAPYVITDATEQALIGQGVIPADMIPLVIQDKTFVPPVEQLAIQDPTWDLTRWGGFGDLWVPHVYVPAQNPGDASGVNPFGRWAYGPWFWPPTTNIAHGPVANPYFDPNCNPDVQWCEPPLNPGVPNVSMGMEAFNDTPVVNGTAYPTITVEPKAYRFRILSAANDRFFNLSLYVADASGTEVQLNPAEVAAALADQTIFPTPVAGTEGPDWIQIGTEGGFLPAPVVIPAQPTTWVNDPTVFNAGNVDQHSLLLGPAERADVIVDFSRFAGQTLILYNDAPAAFPARDPRYDYYTGNADLTATGGAPSTIPGYGPNTRTVMQIKVANTPPAAPYDIATLEAAFAHHLDGTGVFESSQHPIIVGQNAYNSAYGTAFRLNGPLAGLVQIFNTSFSFMTLSGLMLTMPLQPKQVQDEMGEAFDHEYGRMSGFLGVERPGANAGVQNMILYPYVNPATEVIDPIELPYGPAGSLRVDPIATADDGTQVWKITHNGVDTHPLHFHLYDVQLVNRVGWDGIIRRPDPNELGWKDTVRVSPLEDTIVALRPILPKSPFGLPDSYRPLNPMMPIGDTSMFNSTDTNGNPIVPPITNQFTNFGWEYVWHCHILSHEEMDMMRPVSVLASRALPAAPVLVAAWAPGDPAVALTWTDGTPVDLLDPASWGDPAAEVGFRVERATLPSLAFATIATTLANQTAYTDTAIVPGAQYLYRVVAFNAAGDSPSQMASVTITAPIPAAPTGLQGVVESGPTVRLTWTDNSDNETAFVVERSEDGTAFAVIASLGAGATMHVDDLVVPGRTYFYRVYALNAVVPSGYSNTAIVAVPAAPLAPTNATATVFGSLTNPLRVRLTFRDNALDETGFLVMRSVNGGVFSQVAALPPRANRGSVTWNDLDVQAGTTYAYAAYALNGPSPSAPSNTATAVVPPAPAAPSNLLATAQVTGGGTTARINLTWVDNSADEQRFQVQRSTSPDFTAQLATTNLAANVTTATFGNLARGTTYYLRVKAQNAYGSSAWVETTITTP